MPDATEVWGRVVAEMREFADALKAGGPLPGRVTVFEVTPRVPPPPAFDAAGVRAVRAAVGATPPVFGALLGASAATVRAWERGAKVPSPMARRLLAEVAADPARWRAKLAPAPTTPTPARRPPQKPTKA